VFDEPGLAPTTRRVFSEPMIMYYRIFSVEEVEEAMGHLSRDIHLEQETTKVVFANPH
jgi:hypothetical protein